MERIFKLSLMVVMIVEVFIYPAFGQDTLKIDTELLEISVISVETGDSFPAYVGKGPVIYAPSLPSGGMSMAIGVKDDEGNVHLYLAGEVKASDVSVLIKVNCKVKNVSGSLQSFRVGDISMTYNNSQIDFVAVGRGRYVFAKDEANRNIVKKKEFKLEPNDEIRITYLFGVLKDSPSWRLTYKGNKGVELKGKEKKSE